MIGKLLSFDDLIYVLIGNRGFSNKQINQYLKDVYRSDLEYHGSNLNDEVINSKEDITDASRQSFSNKVRNKYLDTLGHGYCEISIDSHAYEVHHIHPLKFGGDNSFYNLIHINYKLHHILHCNPFQFVESFSHMAVDHLANFFRKANFSVGYKDVENQLVKETLKLYDYFEQHLDEDSINNEEISQLIPYGYHKGVREFEYGN